MCLIFFSTFQGIDPSTFFLTYNGCPLESSDIIDSPGDCATVVVRAYPIVRGGKGGTPEQLHFIYRNRCHTCGLIASVV